MKNIVLFLFIIITSEKMQAQSTFQSQGNQHKITLIDGQIIEFMTINEKKYQQMLKDKSWVLDKELTEIHFDIPVYCHKENRKVLVFRGGDKILLKNQADFLNYVKGIKIFPDKERNIDYISLRISDNLEFQKYLKSDKYSFIFVPELSKKDEYSTYRAKNGEILTTVTGGSTGFLFANLFDYKDFMKHMMETNLPIPVIVIIPNQENQNPNESQADTGNKH